MKKPLWSSERLFIYIIQQCNYLILSPKCYLKGNQIKIIYQNYLFKFYLIKRSF